MIGVVVSRADRASVAIGEQLVAAEEWEERRDADRPDGDGGGTYHVRDGFELREFEGLHVELVDVADAFADPDFVVFVSRHAGQTGPLLTAHFTGNVGPAEYGGEPNELALAAPNALARVVDALSTYAPSGYDVGIECTHHGPSAVGAPSMFVEVGSAEPQWRDAEAAAAVARAVLDLEGVSADGERTVVGFGGGHYAPRFARILRETDWAIGHVVADWAIEAAGELSPDVVDQAFERSRAGRAVVDGERTALVRAIEERGYDVVGETWIRETDGVPLGLVDRAETTLVPVESGLRFGARRAEALATVAVNPELVGAAYGIDPEGTRGAFVSHVVAYVTEENGNRPTGQVCVPDDESVEPLVESLTAVLREGGAAVERNGDEVVVEESAFDPEKARERGVPEGPAFGRLASGETVTVDGETVTPDSVHTTRTRRFPIERESD